MPAQGVVVGGRHILSTTQITRACATFRPGRLAEAHFDLPRQRCSLRARHLTIAFLSASADARDLADDGARLYVDHELVVDTWDSPVAERRAHVALVAGSFHDLVLEWKEETGSASVFLEFSSFSTRRQVIPSSAL